MVDKQLDDPASASDPSGGPRSPAPDPASTEDRQFNVAEMMIGTTMIFTGFINVLLSISGGFEISVLPLILYFAGLAIWAHARVENPSVRYTIITLCFAAAAGFFQYGEVHFWHKQVIFWGTILIAVFFMFSGTPKKTSN
jgi:hypothetical protein